jgi:serine/threonine protein kinase
MPFDSKDDDVALKQNREAKIDFHKQLFAEVDWVAVDLLKKMLEKSGKNRISTEDALLHKFFSKNHQVDEVGLEHDYKKARIIHSPDKKTRLRPPNLQGGPPKSPMISPPKSPLGKARTKGYDLHKLDIPRSKDSPLGSVGNPSSPTRKHCRSPLPHSKMSPQLPNGGLNFSKGMSNEDFEFEMENSMDAEKMNSLSRQVTIFPITKPRSKVHRS